MTAKLVEVTAARPSAKVGSLEPSTRTFRVLTVNSDAYPTRFQQSVIALLKDGERVSGMVELASISEDELRNDCRVWGADALGVKL